MQTPVHQDIETFYKSFTLFRPFVTETSVSYKIYCQIQETQAEAQQLIERLGLKLKVKVNYHFKTLLVEVDGLQ